MPKGVFNLSKEIQKSQSRLTSKEINLYKCGESRYEKKAGNITSDTNGNMTLWTTFCGTTNYTWDVSGADKLCILVCNVVIARGKYNNRKPTMRRLAL